MNDWLSYLPLAAFLTFVAIAILLSWHGDKLNQERRPDFDSLSIIPALSIPAIVLSFIYCTETFDPAIDASIFSIGGITLALLVILVTSLNRRDKLLQVKLHQAIILSVTIGGTVAIFAYALFLLKAAPSKSSSDLDLKNIAIIVGGIYFIYQALSGAFFATISISIEAEREKSSGLNDSILVKVNLERGDQWLVDILYIQYLIEPSEPKHGKNHDDKPWKMINFPSRSDSILRLAPKEKAQTRFVIPNIDKYRGYYITARVISAASWWPLTSESLSRTYVPSGQSADSKEQCSAHGYNIIP